MAIDSALGRLGAKAGVCTSSTRPTNPFEGQIIYESDTNRTLVWDNSAWVVIADASTTGFPTSLDTNSVGAIQALQAKVGVDGSAVTTSLDYKVNALPSNVGGSSYVYSYTLTTSDTSFISHSYTSPAENRLVSLSYTGLIEDIQAGGRIVNFKPQVSFDGGSTFTLLGHYYYWLTFDTSDALVVSFVTTFTTSSNTDIVGRVLASKSSGTTGAVFYNYLVLTDLGAA